MSDKGRAISADMSSVPVAPAAIEQASPPVCPICGTTPSGPIFSGHDRLLAVPGQFDVFMCESCDLGITSPRLEAKELGRYYPDTYGPFRGAPSRAVVGLRQFLVRLRLSREPFRSALGGGGGGSVLDVGCGRGDLAGAFAQRGWRAFGVEPSPAAVEVARAQGVDARVGTLDTTSWPPGEFDLVVFNHSLEHVDDPVATAERARLLLRPGGQVLIAVPDWGSRHSRVFRSSWFHLDLPRHLHHFTRQSLAKAMVAAGLEVTASYGDMSMVGLLGSLQYRLFGRCVVPAGRRRLALLMTAIGYPVWWVVGKVVGGDTLYVLAQKPAS